ncbi:MAG: peptidylprolyl isomerase [Pseudomonadota bacterium]
MASLLKQPLLHFLLIGAAFFGLFAVIDDSPDLPDRPQIVVSEQDALWLAGQFQATWRRPPTPDELSGLVEEYVREEIYVREALALGLDQGDTIVRRRLRQKMEFLSEAGAEAATPDEAALRAHFDENADQFRAAPRVAFLQILLPPERPEAADEVRASLAAGADPEALGQRTLLPHAIPPSTRSAVDGTFGTGFFDAVALLSPGEWAGPVTSGYGAHLVRLDAAEPGALPPFEEVRDRVELDWRADMADRLRTERFDTLSAQYDVVRPDAAAVLAQ